MGAEARLKQLNLELPTPLRPMANYVTAVRSGNLLFLSGHGPVRDGRVVHQGRIGRDLTIEQGREAARLTGLNLLATARQALGSLDHVRRVVKVLGMVQCADDFTDHPTVINGFSDLMVEVFGDAGRHARSAVGMGSLPFGIAVEIEMILEVSGATPGSRPARTRRSTRRTPSARRPPARRRR
jgi:enamine deaminase RidA (YjgF/YER057c/UK114 family)